MKDLLIKNKFVVLFWIFLLIFIVIFLNWSKKGINEMLKQPKFTIAVISSKWHYKTTWKSPGVDFKLRINNEEFERTTRNNLKLGDKYLYIYDSLSYNYSGMILLNYPLPDSIQSPKNGWRYDEVPIPIDSVRIRKYVLGEE